MTAESSKQPTAGDSALLSLHNACNPTRRAMGVGLIKPALDSTNDLLDTIRESRADMPEYIGLEQSCVGVREVLNRGTDRRPGNHLSQSGLEAIEELTATVNEIKRGIVKQGKRRAISRVLHSKKNRGAIVSWRLNLNKIICTLSSEFGSGEPASTPDPRHKAAESRTAAPDVHPGNSNAETIPPIAPHDISDSRVATSQVPAEVAKIHALDHEMHRNATESVDSSRNPGHSTHVSVSDRSAPPLSNTCGMTPDICPHFGQTHAIADNHETINGGTCNGHQVAANSISGESPPPPQRIFGREELVKNIVDLADTDHPTPIALTGTGGIGKTSVALAVLHNDRIKQRFGSHRRLLRCDQFSASLPNFLRRLSEVIGAGIANPADLTSLRPFLSRHRMLIIIDNAESIFDGPTTKDIDPVVVELSQFRNICLCITSRTSAIPARCKVIDVPTLSMEAARETFHNVYRRGEQSGAVDDILKQLDFHPLSIILLATAAKYNKWGIGQLEKEWGEQRTGVLRTRYQGSLAATIEFSLRSPMFRDLGPHARDLLGVVAFFPQGVEEKNLDWLFPSIVNRKKIFGHFCVLSLTHRNQGFITMLAPLRDHLCPKDPMSASLFCSVKEHYFNRLSFSIGTFTPSNDGTTWIASEDINVEHLLDVFTSIDANSERTWDACWHFMIHIYLHKPRLPVFGPRIWALPDGYPSKPRCLLHLSTLCLVTGNSAENRRLLCHVLKLYRERGDDRQIASTLWQLATTDSPDDEGIQQTREALQIYQRLGDMIGVAMCYTWLSSLFCHASRLDDAEKCESQAIGLIDALMPTASSASRSSLYGCLHLIYLRRGDTEKVISNTKALSEATPIRSEQFMSHSELAKILIIEGRFDDAEAHLERARSLAASGSSEVSRVVTLRAHLLRGRGKFEEARSEALRALDLAKEFGGGEEVKGLLHSIDQAMAVWASEGGLGGLVAWWAERLIIRATLDGEVSQSEKIYKAATKMMALLEMDGNRPGGPNFFQIEKALKELELLGHPSDDNKLNGTIAGSLAIPTVVGEPDEMPPPEPLMRQDNKPVVIWTTDPKLAHIGQLWQVLYHVPQARHRISQYRSPHPPEGNTKVDIEPSFGGTGGYVSSAHEFFGHMELSGLAVVMGKFLMERFPHQPWEGTSPRKAVEKAYKELSEQVEISLNDGLATQDPDWPRLFHSRINDTTSQGRSTFDAKKDISLISLVYNNRDEPNDLMECLTNQVFSKFSEQGSLDTNYTPAGGPANVEPADVIAFALARDESPPFPAAGRSQQPRKFSFPESFRLDRFVTASHPHVQNVAEGEILRKTGSDLVRVGISGIRSPWPSECLLASQDKDFMGSLLSSLHYYENVASSPTDAERHEAIESSAAKLKEVIAQIDAERNSIGTTVEQLEKEPQNSSSSEKNQQNKYDLRAVLMHDGQKGREHVYSYINHEDAWWKVVDCTVTKVTLETVLNDENGMDVGAGPFFLIYSRSLSEPLKSEWPETLENAYTGMDHLLSRNFL